MVRILVTGAVGFIGYNLIRQLYADEIIGIDNFDNYYDVSIKKQRLHDLEELDNFKFYEVDICNRNTLEAIFKVHRPHYVVHLAAQAGVRFSQINPRAYINSNVIGFFNVCECCNKFGVKHLVYASSSSVYGDTDVPSKETDELSPKSLYAITKHFNEQIASTYDFYTTGLRFFSVYGGEGGGRTDMFISKAIRAAENDEVLYINGDGNQQRDFTFINDICCGIIMSLDESKAQEKHRIYNLGYGSPNTLNQIVDIIEQLTGKKIKKVYRESNALDVQCTWADCSKAKKELGWEARINLEEGLRRSHLAL